MTEPASAMLGILIKKPLALGRFFSVGGIGFFKIPARSILGFANKSQKPTAPTQPNLERVAKHLRQRALSPAIPTIPSRSAQKLAPPFYLPLGSENWRK